MVTQGSADGLDGYDIVASTRIVGKDSYLIEYLVKANILNVERSRTVLSSSRSKGSAKKIPGLEWGRVKGKGAIGGYLTYQQVPK